MKIVIGALLSFFYTDIYSQVVKEWQYDNTITNPTVVVTDVVHDGQNTFVTIQNFDQEENTYLQKLDSNGNLLQSDTIKYSYSICDSRMVRDNQGAIYVCGQEDSPVPGSLSKIKIAKFDSMLNAEWTVSVIDTIQADYFSPRMCYSSADNKIYVVCQKFDMHAYYTCVLKFDTGGTLIWESDTIPSLGLNCIRFTMDMQSNIILGGFRDFPGTDEDFTIVKINTSGSIDWNISMHHLLDDRVEDLAVDMENNIYAFGYFSDAVSSKVVKYDSAGNLVWMSGINNFYGTKVTLDNSGIYVAGVDSINSNLTIVKLDSSGSITGSHFTSRSASGIISAKLSNTSQLYVCYTSDSSGDYRWAVSKFDSTINIEWSFIYPDTTPVFSYPTSLYVLDDGFIVSGLIDPYISTARFRELMSTNIKSEKYPRLVYWPNPGGKTLYFDCKASLNEKIYFKLYDINSRCLFEKHSGFKNGEQIMIELPDMKNGIYFFILGNGEKIYSDKLVVN